MIDRRTPPPIQAIDNLFLTPIQPELLSNGIPVYTLNKGSQEVCMISFLFYAGSVYEQKHLVASLTNALLKEGTSNKNAQEIAEQLDFYGAYLEVGCEKEIASLTLYSLNKHLANTLPLVATLLQDSVFPTHELEVLLQRKKQQFIINQDKVKHIAQKEFYQTIFGENTPYGKIVYVEDFDAVTTADLRAFHQQYYTSSNCKIIIAGHITRDIILQIEKTVGATPWKHHTSLLPSLDYSPQPGSKQIYIAKDNALQSAIRIGKPIGDKKHPDYLGLKIVNTLLGGYFGSRLMTNIREDKGYTYGISSGVFSFLHQGVFYIQTEVDAIHTQQAIDEIYSEIHRLQQELVLEEELSLVKNYLLGTFLGTINGPFSLAEMLKNVIEYDMDFSYYNSYIETIRSITPSDIQRLALTYFEKESFHEIVAGKK